ncbi:hypothetical protein Tco_1034718 [Tanacetum coccineum]
MVRLWWLWWPQPARPPPQRWHQAAEHSEAPPRGCAATARHHMGRATMERDIEVVVWWQRLLCPVDGVCWKRCRGCWRRRWCCMSSVGVSGGVESMGSGGDRSVKIVTGLMCGGCDEVGDENDDDGSGALAEKNFRRPENAMEAPNIKGREGRVI